MKCFGCGDDEDTDPTISRRADLGMKEVQAFCDYCYAWRQHPSNRRHWCADCGRADAPSEFPIPVEGGRFVCRLCGKIREQVAKVVVQVNEETIEGSVPNIPPSGKVSVSLTPAMKEKVTKWRASLVPSGTLQAIAEVMQAGIDGGHVEGDWAQHPYMVYYDALQRHLDAFFRGALIDPKSGKPALDHALASLAILRWHKHRLEAK